MLMAVGIAAAEGRAAPAAGDADSPAIPPAPARANTNLLTLDNAIRLALANNPELRASRGRVAASAGRAYQARLWPNPQLTLGTEDVPVSGGSFRESKNTIGLDQRVPFPGKKKLDAQIGVAGVSLTQAEWALRRLGLVRDVKVAFYRVLAAQRLTDVGRELVQVAATSETTARKRVEAGAAADQEQLRAEIQAAQARAELSGFERDLATARQDLNLLLGSPDLPAATVFGDLTEAPDRSLLGNPPERWLAQHPSAAAARAVRDRAEVELRRARLEPYPDVTFGVDGGREGTADTAIVQFRLGVPLPIIDRSKGRKQEARANADVAQAELAATEQRLLREWGAASERFRAAADQVTIYREQILPKATRALRLVQTGFEQGKFGFIDLLDTQRTTAEARLAYQQKLLELNAAQAELEAFLEPQPQRFSTTRNN